MPASSPGKSVRLDLNLCASSHSLPQIGTANVRLLSLSLGLHRCIESTHYKMAASKPTFHSSKDGGVYGIRTREIPDRQSGGVDHWPNTPKWRIGGVPTSRGSFRPPIRFPSEADCQFQHLSKMAELSGFGPPRDLATPTGGLANRCLTRLGLQLLGGRGEF